MISLKKIYIINKQITFKTSMLQSHLCDYSDPYVAEVTITFKGPNNDP